MEKNGIEKLELGFLLAQMAAMLPPIYTFTSAVCPTPSSAFTVYSPSIAPVVSNVVSNAPFSIITVCGVNSTDAIQQVTTITYHSCQFDVPVTTSGSTTATDATGSSDTKGVASTTWM